MISTVPDVSVVIATYNRASILPVALESILNQDAQGATYEVILVDNNSTDQTAEIVKSFIDSSSGKLRYIFEPNQGVSFARNAAIEKALAPIIAFFDDDVEVASNWIATIKQTLDSQRDVSCIGGKVLPRWESDPPAWLTREHWAPLALQDYGEESILVNFKRPLCLISANLAVRRAVFDEIGLFKPELQRVKDSIGSMEDMELLMRLWRAQIGAMYIPDLIAETMVPLVRATKNYHRRWHRGNGHFYAMLRCEDMENSSAGHLFGIPAHQYRQAFEASLRWVKKSLAGNSQDAFLAETRLQFILGFAQNRRMNASTKKEY